MEEKKASRLEMFEELCKQFYKLVLEMDAVRQFKEHCEDPATEDVVLQNPVNYHGHLHLKPQDAMPFVDAEMQKKQERARQLAESIKSLLDEGNYELWNLLKEKMSFSDCIADGITATFDRDPDGLVEQYKKELNKQ